MSNKKFSKPSAALLIAILFTAASELAFINIKGASAYEGESLRLDIFTQKAPFDGKGLNQSSDAFAPYEVVRLNGNVTYDGKPLANVLVTFNITGPSNYTFQTVRKTDDLGLTSLDFSFPEPNDKSIIGTWTVKAWTEHKGRFASDILTFKVDWIVKILSVKTVNSTGDYQSMFSIGGEVGVEVTLRNIARIFKNTTLFVGFHDELNEYFGNETEKLSIEPNNRTVKIYFKLPIPRWMVPRNAVLYACAFTPHGTAYCPQVFSNFKIAPSEPTAINIHDVSIINLELSRKRVTKGEKIDVAVTIRNEGTETENVTINLYCNSTAIGSLKINNLKPYATKREEIEFITADLTVGKYQILAEIASVPYEAETEDNFMTQEFMVYTPYYDLAVIEVSPLVSEAMVGDEIPIAITLENNGTEIESFTVEFYGNSTLLGKMNISNLMPGKTINKIFVWNTGNFAEGSYIIKALMPPLPGEENIENNFLIDGIIHLWAPAQPFHDLSIESVSVDKIEATIGEIIMITIHVKNLGSFTEEFKVEVYVNQTSIGNQTLRGVAPSSEKIVNFIWNTSKFKEGKYYIKVIIPPLPTEENTENNFYEYGPITLMSPTPPHAWNMFILLLTVILLLLILLSVLALRKRRKRKAEKGRLVALIKLF